MGATYLPRREKRKNGLRPVSAVKDRLGEAVEAIAHVEHQLMMKRSFAGVRLG